MFHPKGPSFLELTKQALSSTETGYDLLAPKFDYTPFRTPEPILAALTAYLREGPVVGRAVDLCCGTGAVMNALVPVVTDEVVGVDFSAGMLTEARKLVPASSDGPALRFEQRDVFAMPPNPAYELATCFGALGHVPYGRERDFLRSVRGVLKPGGRFVFVSGSTPRWWSRAYLFSKGFNTVMHVRNAIVRPSFVMFYLRFLVPEVTSWLEAEGFSVRLVGGIFPAPFERCVLVEATR